MVKTGISVIITILNETQSIEQLLNGLLSQTRKANEVVIADAGSTDGTVQLIKAWQQKHKKFPFKVITKKGNRSVGRNAAIKKTTYELIAITDAGCIPHKRWLEELEKKYMRTDADVVAGYYDAAPRTALEEAIVPYMLVMPDKVNKRDFLPATRSMLIKKSVWKELGGFDESLTISEDYAFAKKLKSEGYTLTFTNKAKVTWLPFSSLTHFFNTVRQMAEFDVRAGVVRIKALSVIGRYLAFILIALFSLSTFVFVFTLYLSWATTKNLRYVTRGWYWLPVLQLVADVGVMIGTLRGVAV